MIRVLCVDDHPMLRAGLAATIASETGMEVVGEAGDGATAVELYAALRPDVVLMDLRLPGLHGVEAIARIRAMNGAARVIVLTTYDNDSDILRALQAGARAYLLKDMLRRELVDAIRAVQAGGRYLSPAVAQRLEARGLTEALSARELEVLECVVRGQSNKEIAGGLGLSEGTVRIHLSHVFEKLGVRDRTQAAILALQRGYVSLD